MFLKFLLFINILNSFRLVHGDEPFYFGVINHDTQWHFHCPHNHTKVLHPPLNDQPLISYECPHPALPMEILPLEIDFTFMCRLPSHLIWLIIDLYQYNTFLWLIDRKDIEISIELNHQIRINNSKVEAKNYTNRLILINAFYIPFESIDILLNEHVEINIRITNANQLNQCEFIMNDNYLWKTLIDKNCNSTESKTRYIQYAKCDFYSNKSKSIDLDLFVPSEHETSSTTATTTTTTTTTQLNHISTTTSMSYDKYYLLIEENYHRILTLLVQTKINTIILKLVLIFLISILIVLILFFIYLLHYHYRLRLELSSASLIRRSSTLL